MGRSLRYAGLGMLVILAWILLADAVGWLPQGFSDVWGGRALRAGMVFLGVGFLLGILSPLGRELRRGHCARCGAPIERGQTYCMDHLQQTLNEFRDRTRESVLPRPHGRA